MWGTRVLLPLVFLPGRFIPTYVGNSAEGWAVFSAGTVHPHVCGELGRWLRRKIFQSGSSPRMWGTLREMVDKKTSQRFIPTYVGNSREWWSKWWPRSVHPHVCGELGQGMHLDASSPGSSPRMWGTLHCYADPVLALRFIPTYVGNSLSANRSASSAAVHPHVCGELGGKYSRNINIYGSSPRMWGTLVMPGQSAIVMRFIPTYVGNSLMAKGFLLECTVHPHVCGEL